jgi:hypothetical protein
VGGHFDLPKRHRWPALGVDHEAVKVVAQAPVEGGDLRAGGTQRIGQRAQRTVERVAVQSSAYRVGLGLRRLQVALGLGAVGAGADEPVQQGISAGLIWLGLAWGRRYRERQRARLSVAPPEADNG